MRQWTKARLRWKPGCDVSYQRFLPGFLEGCKCLIDAIRHTPDLKWACLCPHVQRGSGSPDHLPSSVWRKFGDSRWHERAQEPPGSLRYGTEAQILQCIVDPSPSRRWPVSSPCNRHVPAPRPDNQALPTASESPGFDHDGLEVRSSWLHEGFRGCLWREKPRAGLSSGLFLPVLPRSF